MKCDYTYFGGTECPETEICERCGRCDNHCSCYHDDIESDDDFPELISEDE